MNTQYSGKSFRLVLRFFGALLFCSICAQSQVPTIERIGTLGGSYSITWGINAQGEVIGSSRLPGDVEEHAFIFRGGAIQDLGTLGGPLSAAFAINKNGQVVGESYTESFAREAFLYERGTIKSLGTLGGSYSTAIAINDAGQIVGSAATGDNVSMHAFLYAGGGMTDLGTLGGYDSSAVMINSTGWITGNSTTADGSYRAFIWTPAGMVNLGTLGGTTSRAEDINDSGWITGYAYTAGDVQSHAFIYDGTKMIDLGTLGGGSSSGYIINNKGQVAGDSETETGTYHAFLYSDGRMMDLGELGGGYSAMYDMNNLGQVVGDSLDGFSEYRACLWENGTMTDLNTLLPPNSDWVLETAYNINDAGQIVGLGRYQGVYDNFVLSLNRAASSNSPPIANAGSDQLLECKGARTEALLDGSGSNDPDGDTLTYEWFYQGKLFAQGATARLSFGLGSVTMLLKVTDSAGASSEDEVLITVADTKPPLVACPETRYLSANSTCQALVPDLLANLLVSDDCSSAEGLLKSQSPAAGETITLGTHTINITVTDPSGNQAVCTANVVVQDTTPPIIQEIIANPPTLSRPNGKMEPMTLTVLGTDNCSGTLEARIVGITSNEPETGPGDKTTPDWEITGALSANLRAESNGRVYTLSVECIDASGNKSIKGVSIQVLPGGPKVEQTDSASTNKVKSR